LGCSGGDGLAFLLAGANGRNIPLKILRAGSIEAAGVMALILLKT